MGASPTAAAPTVELDRAGELVADRDIPVGGQAVIEGVMMRGVSHWAVAARRPDGTITRTLQPLARRSRHRSLRVPVVRGFVALCSSLAIGMKALEVATNAQLERARGTSRRRRSPV